MPHSTVIADGAFDFAGGVNSQAVTTLQSSLVPHGLRRDQLSWMNNATVRGGGILQRTGWFKLLDVITSGLYQGGLICEPPPGNPDDPYLVLSVSGRIYKAILHAPFTVTDLSAIFGVTNSATSPQAFFVQGEGIMAIQSGDGVTLPLFYVASFSPINPEFMRRSNGLTGNLTGPNISELPAANAMVYYAGRIWYAQDRTYSAGDMVGNQSSGGILFKFRNSIFRVTENPLAFGGDGFTVPSQGGNIRALAYTANLDTNLGQGPLYIFTRKQVYSLTVPVTRADWIAATNNNQPLQTVSQINSGTSGERTVVHVNGDLFYQSFDPAIRSLIVSTRFYGQWGNIQISNNENRALQFNDRSLMKFASGIEFDNRLLQGILPKQTPSGVVCQGIAPLDFDLVSSLQDQAPPAWEGMWEGVDILQLFTEDFNGLPRAFAVVKDRLDLTIDVWEISNSKRFDNAGTPATAENRVGWFFESPAFTWQKEFALKQLHGGELWIDKVFGHVNIKVEYRPDADPCWKFWHNTNLCVAHSCAEDVNNPDCYPIGPNFREGYKFPVTLPEPPAGCDSMGVRPANIGYQFQIRVTILGWCRVRGVILYAEEKEKDLYGGLTC